MYTIIAFLVVGGAAFCADRQHRFDSDAIETNTKQTRQDLRLVAYFLAGILLMLGIIADRIH